ncbi:hypothetical protein L1987_20929 [Smallanthus sonchifolius]|uniref:Uncharacterized protein n=1 Tax=Smallanthus sonchifolius TaxID=185202 RepID=A0ACB9IUN2_9ASTR|nr:hypothetical protein L1987_20929 [Smallanthus sonchifolius]
MEGRLFSITINQNLSEAGINSLRSLLSEKNPNTLGGRSLLNHCLARSLSSIALEAFKVCQETVNKVRDCVKYVKTSDVLEEKFLELKQQLQVPSMKTLALDDQTRWNTTYEMLLAASELKEVFSCIDTTDADYTKGPTAEEWKQVENLCTYVSRLVFETERKEMDRYRCSLRPETVEAVVCTKDWLVGGGDSVDMMKSLVKMEFPI